MQTKTSQIQVQQAKQSDLQDLFRLGLADPALCAVVPNDVLMTRVWWVYVDGSQAADLDAWIDYAEVRWPGVDLEAVDMAIGCC
jgi:hypothetical protein